MRLDELHKPKEIRKFRTQYHNHKYNSAGDPIHTAREMLAKYGFEEIGSGGFGYVFANEKYPYVLKLFFRDSAYLKWFNFCRENQDNPYVPQIKGKYMRVVPNEEVYAVRMERLKPTEFFIPYQKLERQIGKRYEILYGGGELDSDDPYLDSIVTFLYEGVNFMLDLHRNNVMQRENGQLVIIDPVF